MATARKTATSKPPARKKAALAAKTRARVTPAAQAPVRAAPPKKATPPAKGPKAEKARKPKLVRDSFTIPKAEYVVLQQLKQRSAQSGQPAKKSEVLRAGIKALAAMGDAAFLAALGAVPPLKTGRPAKD